MAKERFHEHDSQCVAQYRQTPYEIEVTVMPGVMSVPIGEILSISRIDPKACSKAYPLPTAKTIKPLGLRS